MTELNHEELEEIIKNKWTNELRPGYVTVKGCMLPEHYKDIKKEIDDLEVYDDDIWICSFPRTGTTWTSEMVWMIVNDLNFEKAQNSLNERVIFIDLGFILSAEQKNSKVSEVISDPIDYVRKQPRPRIIKTHLPFQLLPKQIQNGQKKPKIVYVYRNPLDAYVSYFYHASSVLFTGNKEEFLKLCLAGKVVYGDFFAHVLSFWQLRNQSNVLILRYEDMKKNLTEAIQKTANFFNKKISDVDIEKLLQHLSFDSMKNNPFVNNLRVRAIKDEKKITPFIRSGVVGGYKSEMSASLVETFQKWFKENQEKTGIPF